MASNQDRTIRWIENAMGWNDKTLSGRDATVFSDGDSIYSYGHHFEMARVLRDHKGNPRCIWVNGDTYSVTTSGHQGDVRSAARRACLPTFIVPFRALRAAGIRVEDIEPIDIRPDRQEAIHHSAAEITGAHLEMDDPEGRTEPVTRYRWKDADATFREREAYEAQVPVRVANPNRRYVQKGSWTPADWDPNDEVWRWVTTRHWLGDSLIRAKMHGRRERALFLSSFDHQEARPLYFLCELPRGCGARTVVEAYEALKPESVKLAESAGLEPARQGDIFAIPTELTTREVKKLTPHGKGRIVKRPANGVLGTRHTATEIIFGTEGRVYARGTLYHEPEAFRDADHARRRMSDGKTWHLLNRNTVPRQRERSRV